MKKTISFDQSFDLLDIRVGTIVTASIFEKARNPAFKIGVDFGLDIGIKQSSAQITHHYVPDKLIGTQVIAILNFPPRNIAGFMSEILILGIYDEDRNVVLLRPDKDVSNGAQIG